MTFFLPVDQHSREAVLTALRTDFGRLTPLPGLALPIETNGDASLARDHSGVGFAHLAAPPRLHVMAELIAQGVHQPSPNQAFFTDDGAGNILAVMLYIPNTLVLLAGHETAAPSMAMAMRRTSWRILMGDEALTIETLDRWRHRIWWVPKVRTRRQIVMATTGPAVVAPGEDPHYRAANPWDVESVTQMAAALHVDDEMGPPLSPGAMRTLRSRVSETIAHGRTWVMDYEGAAVAKFDIHNLSPVYGAQLSGVVVDDRFRGLGYGTRLVANAIAELLSVGVPQVSLHLREGNAAAVRAYEKAGMRQVASQLMAII